MPLSNFALDKFVAQDYSKLTVCKSPTIGTDFQDYEHWLHNFLLNRILKQNIADELAALAIAIIRRCQAAIEHHDSARNSLESFVNGERTITNYFRSLRNFEIAVSFTYQAFDIGRKAAAFSLFTTGDGSPYEKLNRIYNTSKHAQPNQLPPGQIHTVWLTNAGLTGDGIVLTFEDLAGSIKELARISSKVSRMDASVS